MRARGNVFATVILDANGMPATFVLGVLDGFDAFFGWVEHDVLHHFQTAGEGNEFFTGDVNVHVEIIPAYRRDMQAIPSPLDHWHPR